jgi:ketosteroid isomerase-like protein
MATNVDLVKSGYEAYARRDFAAVFSLFDPELEVVQTPLLPWGGTYRGTDGAREFFSRLAAEVDATPQPESYISAGDDVVAVGRLKGRAKRSGKPIDLAITHVWTVRDGRIVRFAAYIDTPAILEALAM